MPITRKVRDLTVPVNEYATTSVNNTLREAVPALRRLYCQVEEGKCTQAGHRNILVLDQAGDLVGILSFRSILQVLMPEIAGGITAKLEALGVSIAFAQADTPDLDEARATFRARVIRNSETLVKDIMLKVRGTVDIDADLMDAMKVMYQNKITVLPVYEKNRLIGVLRESDLFLTVADILTE
jgi:CBS domain-containing protein